jgi:hypothetical protein
MTTIRTTTDLDTLARAIETRDAETLTTLYAADATLTLLDRDHPPSGPQVFRGRDEIGAYYRDICGRNMEHEVRDPVSTGHGLAWTQHCRYPDGARVVCTTVATVDAGLIRNQTAIQVWDD